jgi:hypothetical protein
VSGRCGTAVPVCLDDFDARVYEGADPGDLLSYAEALSLVQSSEIGNDICHLKYTSQLTDFDETQLVIGQTGLLSQIERMETTFDDPNDSALVG